MENFTEIKFLKDLLQLLPNKEDYSILKYKIDLSKDEQYITHDEFKLICKIIKSVKNNKFDCILECLKDKADYYDISSIDHRIYRKLKVKKAVKPDIEKFIEWAGLNEEEDDCDKCDEMLDYEECNNPAYKSDGYKCKLHKLKK